MNPLNTHPCKACTEPFSISKTDSKFYVCPKCGALLEVGGSIILKSRHYFNPTKNKPISRLELGTTFVYEGKTYKAVNRTRWESNFRELELTNYGGRDYSNEIWVYDEWCMLAQDQSVIYISEDNKRITFSVPFIPKFPNTPKFDQIRDFSNNDLRSAQESGYARIKYFEGEENEIPQLNERIEYGFYTQKNINYVAEWEIDEKGLVTNTSYYKEIEVGRTQLSKYQFLLPNKTRINNFNPVNPIKSELKSFLRALSLAGLVMSVILLLFSWSNGTKDLYNVKVPLADTTEFWVNYSDGYVSYTSKKPINILADNSVCKLSVSCYLESQGETDAEIRILDSNFDEIHILSGEFYLDFSDGETDRCSSTDKYFRLSESDSYHIEISIPSNQIFTYDIKIESGIILSRYFAIAFLLFLILHTYVFVDDGMKKLKRHFELLSN